MKHSDITTLLATTAGILPEGYSKMLMDHGSERNKSCIDKIKKDDSYYKLQAELKREKRRNKRRS